MTPAGGARILTSTPPSLSPPAEWKPPTEFDLIKEWNAHAGRLATMLGLTLVATTFSLSNGAIHDSLFSLDPNATVSWLLGAELLGLSLVGCFLVMGIGLVLRAMQPPAPPECEP